MKRLLVFLLHRDIFIETLIFSLRLNFQKSALSKCQGDIEEDPDYKVCEEKAGIVFYDCISECDLTDVDCRLECNRILGELIENCPCMSGCPEGCPCPEYECPVEYASVLVLYTYDVDPPALVVDGLGNYRQPNFEFDDETEVDYSCGVTFEGKFYIYGGDDLGRQISTVVGCGLKRIGTLSFEHRLGGCATGQGDVYLCFNLGNDDAKKCRKSTDPDSNFEEITESNFEHRRTRVATSQDVLFAVGDGWNKENKAEVYNFETERWTAVASYPYSGRIDYAAVIHSRDSFYVIGGETVETLNSEIIARFSMETLSWTQAGSLKSGRKGHGAIELGNGFLIVGGWEKTFSPLPTEQCTINADGAVDCNSQQPHLTSYSDYPELFHVSSDYC